MYKGNAQRNLSAVSSKNSKSIISGEGPVIRQPGQVSPSEALGIVLKELNRTKLADYTTQRATEILVRFTIYIEKGHRLRSIRDIAEEHVEGFVFASLLGRADQPRRPSLATMHIRRTALRLYFRIGRQVGLFSNDPTIDLCLPPRSCLSVRPLTDEEVGLCRSYSIHSLRNTRHPAAWALAEATARTSEIPYVRVSDLDLDAGRIWLHGSVKTEPRWGLLSSWGRTQLERRIRTLKMSAGEDRLIMYEGEGPQESKQSSSCAAVSDTLTRAGLSSEPDVRPASVAAWAGTRILAENGRIEEVARRLGLRSLDGAARAIGWDWKERAE